MDVFLGYAGKNNKVVDEKFTSYVKKSYSTESETLISDRSLKFMHSVASPSLLVTLQKKGITLILYGFIYQPVPGWKNKSASPLDNQKETAAFLLERYFKYGSKFIENIYGHFSIIIHDSNKGSTLLLRDPSGQNDLFLYNNNEGDILFSNKLDLIRNCFLGKINIDRSYEDFFLMYGFYPYGRTMYNNVTVVPAKTLVKINKDKAIEEYKLSYSSIGKHTKPKNQKDLVNKLAEILELITIDILPSKKEKVAVLLGGFDSALVVALLKKQGFEVETFSFCYKEEKYNQTHTSILSEYLGTKHNWVLIDEKDIRKGFESFSSNFNQPTNWPPYVIQTLMVSQVIRDRGFKYCYTGDGCDTLFYGYPLTYKRSQVMSVVGKTPNTVLQGAIRVAERPWLERKIGRPYQVGLGVLRSAKRKESERDFLTFRIFDFLSLKQLRVGSPPKQKEKPWEVVSKIAKNFDGMSPVKLAYEGKKHVSPNKNKMNGSADASGLVIVSPYMHPLLKSFMEIIPDELLRPKGSNMANGKYILSKMAETKKLLPKSVIYQPKIGAADSPIEMWYQNGLKNDVYRILEDLPFAYNKKYIESLIKETKAERSYSKLISKDTKSIVTISHCISLLVTYASYNRKKH